MHVYYSDVLTDIKTCKVLDYNFNSSVLFDITFNIIIAYIKLQLHKYNCLFFVPHRQICVFQNTRQCV